MGKCMSPIKISNPKNYGYKMEVPCSRCEICRKRLASWWSFRLMQELKVSTSAYFITLTYGSIRTGYSAPPRTRAGYLTLQKRHLQLFIKRLRRSHGDNGKSLKYYAVGEYGGRFKRPHYHVILFNADIEKIIGQRYAAQYRRKQLKLDGYFEMKCDLWSDVKEKRLRGHITVSDDVNEKSVGYTLVYMSKPSRIPEHRNDDREPEHGLMSKGLGASYLTKAMVTWHKNKLEERMYVALKDGGKASMPRYYKLKMYSEAEREKIAERMVVVMEKEAAKDKRTKRQKDQAKLAGDRRLKIKQHNQKF